MSMLALVGFKPSEIAAIRRRIARRAYERRYYAEKAREQRRAYREATKERDRAKRQARARARYWRNPEPYREASRARMNRLYRNRRQLQESA